MVKIANAWLMKAECLYHKLFVRETFEFEGRTIPCFYHPYNRTTSNERQIEMPLIAGLISGKGERMERLLEVGNVIGHYEKYAGMLNVWIKQWTVVDKYEKAPGVINEDIMHFEPSELPDLIVSISTLEHISKDEDRYAALSGDFKPVERWTPCQVVSRLKGMLAAGGRLIFSFTPGFNPEWDYWFLTSMEVKASGGMKNWKFHQIRDPHVVYIAVFDND